MDISLRTHRDYLGQPVSALPTPAFVVSRPRLEKNIQRLLQNVSDLGISFRPHVKTLKTLEVTRMMLDGGKHRSIVASTLSEIEGALPLVDEGILDECLYGFPIGCWSALPRLRELRKLVNISLMVDDEQQIQLLEKFAMNHPELEPWQIFIKVDVGSHRAGLETRSPCMKSLLSRAEGSNAVEIQGIYCHAGHSYGCRTKECVEEVLQSELDGVLKTAQELPPKQTPLVLSIGSTPTAYSIKFIKDKLPREFVLELHAGNFLANDLQQLSTGVIEEEQLSVRVLAEVCSIYAERNEALVNAGVIAMSRETSGFPGFGNLVDQPDWQLVRLSQEHGIVGLRAGTKDDAATAPEIFHLGQKIMIYCQHTCITAAAFHVFYIVDENDVVCDTWIPWKGW